MKHALRLAATVAAGFLAGMPCVLAPLSAYASSHSDAPLIKLDPQANLTDVYAFVGDSANGKVLNIVVNVHPFCEPGDGAIYDKFSDDAIYSIHIADPNTGATLRRYDFRFSGPSAGLKNPNTILSYGLGTQAGAIQSIGDSHQNYTQTYSLTSMSGSSATLLGSNLVTAPPNVGLRTTPLYNDQVATINGSPNPNYGFAVSGATSDATLDPYTKQAVKSLDNGVRVFCGMRDDSFYADIPGIFDLLDPRILKTLGKASGSDGTGVDGFKGYNVLTYAVQIPLSQLPAAVSYTPVFAGAFGLSASPTTGVGVYASVSRPRVTLRSAVGAPVSSGPYIQVNRLGNPLFNEALVALKDKDNYNRDSPTVDATKYATYALNSELATLINTVHGTNFVTTGRVDLQAVFIPDVLRVDTTTDAVTLAGQSGFSRLGFIGGDTVNSPGGTRNAGWPNGRRFGDDVVDVALTAIASGPSYSTVTLVSDNIAANDQVYNQVFPYSATPNAGTRNRKDSY